MKYIIPLFLISFLISFCIFTLIIWAVVYTVVKCKGIKQGGREKMITIDKIEIKRNSGVRPNDNAVYLGKLWCVKKGKPYDSVQFSIRELQKPYFWHTELCIKCGTSERKINRLVRDFAKTITDEEIHGYRQFLEDGEKWGWD